MGIRVLNPGILTTVQDLGRYGYQQFGIPCSGVMDQKSFQNANYLVGNQNGEAVLEFTLFGGSYLFESDTIIALTGADMSPKLDGAAVPMNRPVEVKCGMQLSLGFAVSGCRTYLAAAGGIDVPVVLGSRSTSLKCKIGGLAGRALAAGDVLPLKENAVPFEMISGRRTAEMICSDSITVRVVEGPQADHFTEEGKKTFYSSAYTVSDLSDRMGCRLDGPVIESIDGTDIISDGIAFGSVQVTSSGMPIVLLADRQTTGGYAKIANVCSADLPLLAQARPGNTVRFTRISIEEAQELLKEES